MDVHGALAQARALGFLGPGPLDAHLASAAAFASAIGAIAGEALDLGSGGGVPGLLLAVAFPDSSWVLLDTHRRRTSFLARMVLELGLGDRVVVRRDDAFRVALATAFQERFAVVTARSFGPPAVTAEAAAGFVRRGGRLFVAEPPPPVPAGRWPAGPLGTLGFTPPSGGGRVAVLTKVGPSPTSHRERRAVERSPLW